MTVLGTKYSSNLKFGKYLLKVAILENNTYVLSERDVSLFLGGRGGSSFKRKTKNILACKHISLSAPNLKKFINPTLEQKLSNRIKYYHNNKKSVIYGYEASTVIEMCWVWVEAKEAGKLLKSQEKTYQRAQTFIRALSTIGIVALIKEVTSPQTLPEVPSFWQYLKIKYLSLGTNLHSTS